MKFLICIFSIGMLAVFTVSAQTRKTSLVNTTWNVKYSFCGDSDYANHATIKLLSAGKIAGSRAGNCRLVGDKLVITDDREDYITSLSAAFRGNVATGKGLLGMNPRGFCVRLVRVML
jgi:hypothetical protein